MLKRCQNKIFHYSIAFLSAPFYNGQKGEMDMDRRPPSKLIVGEALARRGILADEQKNLLDELLWRAERGYEGELRADAHWGDLHMTEPHALLHGFEAASSLGYSHQIDTILVTARFVLVVELKNIAGVLSYDERVHQFLRERNGEQENLTNPFAQAERHQAFVKRLLEGVGVKLPVLSAVIITSSSSILENMPERFHIFKLAGLRFKLQEWNNTYPVQVSESVVSLVKSEILAHHQPRKWQHPFGKVLIRRGAICLCGKVMQYRRGKFVCCCGHVGRDAFSQGLHDYRLLVDEWITNKGLRDFFFIASKDAANKYLARAEFHYEGDTRSRRYLIPEDVWRE